MAFFTPSRLEEQGYGEGGIGGEGGNFGEGGRLRPTICGIAGLSQSRRCMEQEYDNQRDKEVCGIDMAKKEGQPSWLPFFRFTVTMQPATRARFLT